MADPEVDAVRVIRLDVDERGIVDLTQWRDVKSSLHAMAHESALCLCSDADGLPCAPLGVLCQRLASYSSFEFLMMQVFYAISLRLEAMLKTFRPTGGKQLAKGSIRLKFPDEADLAGNKEQPYLCAAYVHLGFVGLAGRITEWLSLEAEPSIWIATLVSAVVLTVVMRKG
jgi:predicted small integral membrane protein